MTAQDLREIPATGEPCLPPALRKPRLRRNEASEYLELRHGLTITTATLAKLASTGGGPSFNKAGRVPLYPTTELDAWATERLGRLVRSTSELTHARLRRGSTVTASPPSPPGGDRGCEQPPDAPPVDREGTMTAHPVIPVWLHPNGNDLLYWCEHCKKYHTHGLGGDAPDGVHPRVSHCCKPESPLYFRNVSLRITGPVPDAVLADYRSARPRGPKPQEPRG